MKRFSSFLPYIILTFVITVVFIFTVQIRKPWFGQLINGDQHNLTGSTLKFARIWYHEKPWNVVFGMIEQPRSIETEVLKDREVYVSYPSGSVLPIYLLAEALHKEPTVSMVMGFNLFSHIITALILSYIALFLLKNEIRNNKYLPYFLSWVPGVVFLLLTGNIFWQQNIYFADQAVILPFVIAIAIEIIRDYSENNKTILIANILQTIVIMYGAMTDYLFIFLLVVLYVKRLICDLKNKSLKSIFFTTIRFWWPFILMYGLFFIQVNCIGGIKHLYEKFFERTGLQLVEKKTGLKFFEMFWLQHIPNAFGKQAFWLIWISLLNFIAWAATYLILIRNAINKTKRNSFVRIFFYGLAFTLPHFIQVYALPQHSFMHDFSAFKFSLIIAMVPFVLIIIQLLQISNKLNSAKINKIISFYFMILAGLIILFIINIHKNLDTEDFLLLINNLFLTLPIIILIGLLASNIQVNKFLVSLSIAVFIVTFILIDYPLYKNHFGKSNDNPEKKGNEIRKCVGYNDVVISPVYNAPSNPSQLMAFTMKQIYKITSFDQIKSHISTIKKPYNLLAIFPQNPAGLYDNWLSYKIKMWQCGGDYYVLLNKLIIQ